jgi:hypothetical protein
MPNYTFRNKETGETFDEFMTISEMDRFIEEHPELEIDITSPKSIPALHSGIGLGLRKPDEGFKDLLGEMKKVHNKRGGKINDHR